MGCTNSFMATSGVTYDFTITIDKGSCNPASSILLEVLDPNNTVIYTQTLTGGSQTYSTQFTANVTGAYTINVTRIGNAANCYFLIDDVLVTHQEEVTQILCDDYNSDGVSKYRWGFNGTEKDDEVHGGGNSYDYGFRIYNPRLGRFLSVDPLFKSFSWNSPYSYTENQPIQGVDLDGLEYLDYNESRIKLVNGEAHIDLENFNSTTRAAWKRRDEVSANWPEGNIGFPTNVASFIAPEPVKESVSARMSSKPGETNVLKPTNIEKPKAKSTGNPDRRFKDRKINTAAPSAKTVAGAGLTVVVNVINWGGKAWINKNTNEDRRLVDEHLVILENKVIPNILNSNRKKYDTREIS